MKISHLFSLSKYLFFAALIFNGHTLVKGQTNYSLESQADVDNFDQGIQTITGDLVIGFNNSSSEVSNISDLSSLSNLELIEGNLTIQNNGELNNLNGLHNVITVGGLLTIERQDGLIDMEGLNGLTTTNGLEILESDGLLNLNGLDNLTAVHGELRLSENDALLQLSGLNSVQVIDGRLLLWNCDNVVNFEGLNDLHSVGGDVLLNAEFQSLSGLNNLTSVEGDMSLLSSSLENLEDLIGLEYVGGQFRCDICPRIKNLEGLNNLTYVGGLVLYSSPLLQNIDALSKLDSINGSIRISKGDNLENIDGLINVTSIRGQVSINRNSKIKDIDGLGNVKYIEKPIHIYENDNLENLDGLSSITRLESSLYLTSNPSLNDLYGLSNIENIDGRLEIVDNDALYHLDALSNLIHIESLLKISENDNLQNVDGLANLEYVGNVFFINQNPALQNIDAFTKIDSFHSIVEIVNNDNLTNLNGLKNVVYVDNDFKVAGNNALTDCCGIHRLLENPDAIKGNVVISGNPLSCGSVQEILDSECIDEYNGVFGNVYFDANQNKLQDQDEQGIPGIKVITIEESGITLTNDQGDYALEVSEGVEYTLGLELEPGWEISTDSSFYTFQFEPGNTDNFDFGLFNPDSTPSAQVSIASEATRCNTAVDFYIRLTNDGYLPRNGELRVQLDPQVNYISSSLQMVHMDDELLYSFSELLPFQTIDFVVSLDMPSEQSTGDVLSFHGEVFYIDADDNPELIATNDYESIVLCSYDPNDKQVSPVGLKDEHYTLISDELNYTIRFQNTGNASAIDVRILDTIDENLDIETFRVLNSSHSLTTNMDGRAVEFFFKDIFLIDSLTNEPESHGYVQYAIKPKIELDELTKIENTAHIIFDFNPPIVTNTTENTMVDMICPDQFVNVQMTICEGEDFMGFTQSGTYELVYPNGITCDSIVSLELEVLPELDPSCIVSTDDGNEFRFEIYPNPVKEKIYIKGNSSHFTHQLIDIYGKVLKESKHSEIEVYDLPVGVYFLRSFNRRVSSLQKLVKI